MRGKKEDRGGRNGEWVGVRSGEKEEVEGWEGRQETSYSELADCVSLRCMKLELEIQFHELWYMLYQLSS